MAREDNTEYQVRQEGILLVEEGEGGKGIKNITKEGGVGERQFNRKTGRGERSGEIAATPKERGRRGGITKAEIPAKRGPVSAKFELHTVQSNGRCTRSWTRGSPPTPQH